MNLTKPINFSGRRVSVLGMGKSGLALAKVLKERGAKVLVSDRREASDLKEAIEVLEALSVGYETGGHSDEILNSDILLISPGVSVHSPLVEKALAKGIKVLGEVEIAWAISPAPFIAVTGTNGKSTTVTLIDRMLGERSILAGNIGNPLAGEVERAIPDGFVTAEISSFQLETVDLFRPHVAVLTNVTPDHLDRHPNLEEYFAAKARLFARMGPRDLAVFSADDPQAKRMEEMLRAGCLPQWLPAFPQPEAAACPQIMTFSVEGPVAKGAWYENGAVWYRYNSCAELVLEWIPENFPGLPGPHNLANALAAIAVAKFLQVSNEDIYAALAAHKPLHYRMEEVRSYKGVRFIDDSKATNTSSVIAAIEAFQNEPLFLIAGGKDKGFDFSPLGKSIVEHCQHLALIGEAADRLERTVQACGSVPTYRATSLREAVELGWQKLRESGGVVLLSPACSSFDMFKNAEERGRLFAEYAQEIS
ncbi:MAG: UDP-N-acetylmuramoyl-L-alanine--D-glutamate ligase [bacterium]|nr:UDP-N-acetylmuramoyl-L-alanine--D-glutamate ligase [bacterium]